MSIDNFLISTTESARREGPDQRIVMSSRVRLARNLSTVPFPGWSKKPDRIRALEILQPAVQDLPEMVAGYAETMDNLSNLDKQILVERHLISREHAAKGIGSGLVLNKDQTLSVMINEEDHLRMQSLMPGFQVQQAWQAIDALDSRLEKKVAYAFSAKLGYLTACPTNLGTGIRVSAMLHLPGLVLGEQINPVIQAVNKLGLAVRGLYGEGTDALGNLFQVSNQRTLGESEPEIVEHLSKVVLTLIEQEMNARSVLLEKRPKIVYNHIGRSYGILANAHSISSKETMNLLSLMKLGIDIGMLPDVERCLVDELFIATQPAHIQKMTSEKMEAEQRDIVRADLLRDRLRQVKRPAIPDVQNGGKKPPAA